jgi:hypothetical protein
MGYILLEMDGLDMLHDSRKYYFYRNPGSFHDRYYLYVPLMGEEKSCEWFWFSGARLLKR